MYSDNLVQNPFYEPYIIWFQQLKAKEKTSIYWDKIIFGLWQENKEISYSLFCLSKSPEMLDLVRSANQ